MNRIITSIALLLLMGHNTIIAQDTIEVIAEVEPVVQLDELELKVLLCDGDVSLEDLEKDITYSSKLVELAESGNNAAQNMLGYCFMEGIGIHKDPQQALHWFSIAAEQDNIKALNNLGWCYANGIGVEQDDFQAYSFYKKAALKGETNAFVNLAKCYFNGTGTDIDLLKARAWFEKGAEFGLRVAQNFAGQLYLLEDNYDKAFFWLTKATEQGSPYAMEALGACYEYGWGTEINIQKANELYKQSYELGNTAAKEHIIED